MRGTRETLMQLNIKHPMKARTLKLDVMRQQYYEGKDAEVASASFML